jgi:hypothetical protein
VAIILNGYGGQFEALALLPLLAAVFMAVAVKRTWPVWALATLALIIKHIVLFAVLALFVSAYGRRKGLLLFTCSAVAFLLTFVPYLSTSAQGIWDHVFRYTSAGGYYGFGAVLPTGLASIVFWTGMLIISLIPKYTDPVHAVFVSNIALLVFIYGIGQEYFLLALTFSAIYVDSWFIVLSFTMLITMITAPWMPAGEIMFRTVGRYDALPFDVKLYNLVWVVCGMRLATFREIKFPIQNVVRKFSHRL